MFKIINDLAPVFMKNIFRASDNSVDLRNKPAFQTYNVKSVYFGTETISFRGPQIWSSVPDDIKNAKSLSEFKSKIKKWKPTGCTCRLCKTYVKDLGFVNIV